PHAHSSAAEDALHRARLAKLGPSGQACQALRVWLGWDIGAFRRRQSFAQLLQHPRALLRSELCEGLGVGLLNRLPRGGAKQVPVPFNRLFVAHLSLSRLLAGRLRRAFPENSIQKTHMRSLREPG